MVMHMINIVYLEEIMNQINNYNNKLAYVEDNSYILNTPSPLFQRIEKDKFVI